MDRTASAHCLEPSNKGELVGQSDLALFDLGIDSKLRAYDLVRLLRFALGAIAASTLASCQHPMAAPTPGASIGAGNPYPVSNYTCGGTRLAVRLMGERASVSVDSAAAVDLPVTSQSGTAFSNGRQTLIIEQGLASWAVGRATPVACTGN